MIDIAPDEKIILKARRHWFTLLSQLIAMVVMAILPFVFYFVISRFNFIPGNSLYLLFAVESMWVLFVWLMFCKFWINYYLDVWVITDKRIIDIKQNGFFNREVSTIRLEKIQDITVKVDGIIRSLLHFGTITVQSAGELEEFIMSDIAAPYDVKNILIKLSDTSLDKLEKASPGVE